MINGFSEKKQQGRAQTALTQYFASITANTKRTKNVFGQVDNYLTKEGNRKKFPNG